MSERPHPTPPDPPRIQRKLNLTRAQIAAVVLLLIGPVLSIGGVFGESFGSADASSAEIHLSVEYPSRLRFLLDTTLQVTVENTAQQTLDPLTVHFERDYIDQFAEVSFVPPASAATRDDYRLVLGELAPGESRLITIHFKGSHYGRHEGRIWVTIGEQTAAELQVSSLVYP